MSEIVSGVTRSGGGHHPGGDTRMKLNNFWRGLNLRGTRYKRRGWGGGECKKGHHFRERTSKKGLF